MKICGFKMAVYSEVTSTHVTATSPAISVMVPYTISCSSVQCAEVSLDPRPVRISSLLLLIVPVAHQICARFGIAIEEGSVNFLAR